MSKILKTSGLVIATLLMVFISCKKAGTGGANTLVISPEHHGAPIKGATAYLKFDTKEQPGTEDSDYDLVQIGEQKEDHIHVEGLKPGKYYIYCVGYDSTIFQTVRGGIPLTVKSKSGETAIAVPVTEGD
jgi:hypothetical protein